MLSLKTCKWNASIFAVIVWRTYSIGQWVSCATSSYTRSTLLCFRYVQLVFQCMYTQVNGTDSGWIGPKHSDRSLAKQALRPDRIRVREHEHDMCFFVARVTRHPFLLSFWLSECPCWGFLIVFSQLRAMSVSSSAFGSLFFIIEMGKRCSLAQGEIIPPIVWMPFMLDVFIVMSFIRSELMHCLLLWPYVISLVFYRWTRRCTSWWIGLFCSPSHYHCHCCHYCGSVSFCFDISLLLSLRSIESNATVGICLCVCVYAQTSWCMPSVAESSRSPSTIR